MKFLASLSLLILVACASPETPAQTVYSLQSNYAASLRLEIAYSALPRCHIPTSPPLCSDVATILKVQAVDDTAWAALQRAQFAVRTPGFGVNKTTTAVASAKALVGTFVDVTSRLRVK